MAATTIVAALNLDPGKRIGRHADSVEETILVLEGTAEMSVGDERRPVVMLVPDRRVMEEAMDLAGITSRKARHAIRTRKSSLNQARRATACRVGHPFRGGRTGNANDGKEKG